MRSCWLGCGTKGFPMYRKPEIRLKMRRRSTAPLPLFVFLGRCSWHYLVTVRSVVENAIVAQSAIGAQFPTCSRRKRRYNSCVVFLASGLSSSISRFMLLKHVHTHAAGERGLGSTCFIHGRWAPFATHRVANFAEINQHQPRAGTAYVASTLDFLSYSRHI